MIHLSPRLLALIPLAVGINLAMGKFASATSLPLFLDTVGTVLVAALVGPAAAVVTGIVSQTAFTVLDGKLMWMAFLPVQLGVALYAGWMARLGVFGSAWKSAASGLGLGVLAATLSWPIAYLVFGGVTAGGVTVITTLLTAVGMPLQWAVYGASLSSDLLDKCVTFMLVYMVLGSLPRRMAARFPGVEAARGQRQP
jgi:energy-coupling factor transport system substrate-specific component